MNGADSRTGGREGSDGRVALRGRRHTVVARRARAGLDMLQQRDQAMTLERELEWRGRRAAERREAGQRRHHQDGTPRALPHAPAEGQGIADRLDQRRSTTAISGGSTSATYMASASVDARWVV